MDPQQRLLLEVARETLAAASLRQAAAATRASQAGSPRAGPESPGGCQRRAGLAALSSRAAEVDPVLATGI